MNRFPTYSIALLASVAGLSGCSVCQYARLVAYEEPKLFNEQCDDKASMAAYRAMSDQVWSEAGACCPDDCLEGDYAWGFREGFAQFVYAGGTGDPPAVPPRPYWQLDVRSGEGALAIKSWFEGYRHGAQIARDGGYRRAATLAVSASLRDCDPCGCPGDELKPKHREVKAITGPSLEIAVPADSDMRPTEQPEVILPEPEASPEASPEPRKTEEAAEPARLPEPPLPTDFEDGPSIFDTTTFSSRGGRQRASSALFEIVP